MEKRQLKRVTLVGIDCVDIDRLRLAMEICQQDFEFGAVKILSSLDTNNSKNVIKIDPISSTEEYSSFILKDLHKYIDTDYVLIVQYDGFILNPQAWTDDFMNYDYIGAPWLVADWSVDLFDYPKHLLGKYLVGNGGFSLRSKKLLLLTAEMFRDGIIKRYHPEDVAICVYYKELLEKVGINIAPVELAKKFSFEAVDKNNFKWKDEFGFHGLNWTDISTWSKENPEYKIINPATDNEQRSKWL